MNGRRKYKVTVRVFDHPPGTTSDRFQGTHSLEKQEQQIGLTISKDNTVSSGIKSVNESSNSVSSSPKRNHSSVYDSLCCESPKGRGLPIARANAKGHDRVSKIRGMLDSEFCECTEPAIKPTSLNINKLTRNNAIDQEELQGSNVTASNIINCARTKPSKFYSATESRDLHCWSSVDFEANYGIRKPRNGFPNHLPIVVLNSSNMEEASYEENILNNGVEEDFCQGFDELGRRTDRPPLTREGSACSSDSIITEIEGLTDDESELKSCSNDDGNSAEVYNFNCVTALRKACFCRDV